MTEGLKGLVGKRVSKTVKFMNQDLTINKLNVSEVMAIQSSAKNAGEDENANFSLLKMVIRSSAMGADALSDEDFDTFAIDDLSRLSSDIMKFSGISGEGKEK